MTDSAGVHVRPLAAEDLDEADRICRVAFGTFLQVAIAQRLLDATMDLFAAWETRHVGLFTFAHSAKHVGLYQKYGFWPRFLTAVMSGPVDPDSRSGAIRVSGVGDEDLAGVMTAVRELTDAVYPRLDLSREIEAVRAQRLGTRC